MHYRKGQEEQTVLKAGCAALSYGEEGSGLGVSSLEEMSCADQRSLMQSLVWA